MDLLEDLPDLNLYDPETRIRTRVTGYPPAKVGWRAYIQRSLLDLGCIVNGHVEHSVLSPGVFVEEGAVVRDSIIFDDCRIEAGAIVERSIIDKERDRRQERLRRLRRRLHAEPRAPGHRQHAASRSSASAREIPPYVRIGRNCVIGPNVTATAQGADGYIASGTTIRAAEREFPYGV